MKRKLLQPSESEIQASIINYLKLKKYYVMRLNSGQYSLGQGEARRYIRGHEAGTPDLMAFQHGPGKQILFIEVKKKGNKPTLTQELKMDELEKYGARCIVATSIEDLIQLGI